MAEQEKPTYDVFLSHNSADKPAVEALGNRLREAGCNPFLDKWHLVPGKPWQTELADALRQSACTAIFFGPSGEGAWHVQEMQVALNNAVRTRDDYRVIPVLLPDSDPSQVAGFLELRTWVDFRSGLDDEVALQRLTAAIKGVAPDSAEGLLELPDDPRPYRGIERFEGEQQQFFFGRDEEIRRLIERLEQDRFVAVVGASGSGKSSLARAGFFTDAAERAKPGIRGWRRIVLMPKNNPLLQLAANLVAHLPESERPALVKSFIDDCRSSPDGLLTALSTLFPNPDQPVLLLVDQFEELFTQRPSSDLDQTEWHQRTASFAANLLAAVNHKLDWLRIVVTLRADFVDRFVGGDFPDYRTLLERRQFWLGAMGEDDLREVIVRPATQRGAFFEKGLVERILTEMRGEASALPLLEEALAALWKERRGPWLTHQVYDEIGGVGGALAEKADRVFNSLKPSDQAIARRVFLKLIQLGEGTRDTRRRVSIASLKSVKDMDSDFQAVLDRFSTVGARLITFSSDEETNESEAESSDKTAEVTHEALIDHWDRLSHWLDEGRDDARLERRLEEAAEYWKAEMEKPDGKPDGLLWRPPDLDLARDYVKRIEGSLPQLQFDFYQFSDRAEKQRNANEEQQRQRELEQERRLAEEQANRAKEQKAAATRFKRIAAIAGIVALIAICAGIYALAMRFKAEQETAKAEAATKKATKEEGNAREAEEIAREAGRETNRKLGDANFLLSRIAWEQEQNPMKATHYLYMAAHDYENAEDALETGTHLRALDASHSGPDKSFPSDGPVRGEELTSDGAHLLTWSDDGTARLWDVEQRRKPKEFKHGGTKPSFGGPFSVLGAKLVSDGAYLLTWSDDGTARLWDVEQRQEPKEFKHEGRYSAVRGAKLDSDGARLLTWSDDGTARLWDVDQRQELKEFKHEGDYNGVLGAKLVSDGARLLTWSRDGTARLWDVEQVQEPKRFEHPGKDSVLFNRPFPVLGAELDSDGTRLLTWSEDGTARLWDVEQKQEPREFKHDDRSYFPEVNGAKLVSDGDRLLTWCNDGTARLWDVVDGKEPTNFIHERLSQYSTEGPNILGAKLVSDGPRLLTWSADGTARLWDVEHHQETKKFEHAEKDHLEQPFPILGAELDSDGARLLTWSKDGTARLWDVEQNQELKRFTHLGKDVLFDRPFAVLGAKFISDGARLLTWSEDGTARLWDVEKRLELKRFKHEGSVLRGYQVVDEPPQPDLEQLRQQSLVLGAELDSAGARLLTWSDDGTARLWDVEKGQELKQFKHKGSVLKGELALQGEYGQERVEIREQSSVLGAELVSDGTRLLTWSEDGTVRIWDVEQVQLLKQYGHEHAILGAELVSDGVRLLTWSADGSVQLWDVEQAQPLIQFKHKGDSFSKVNGAELVSDGARLLTWSSDGAARLWNTDTRAPPKRRILEWQVKTATTIDNFGECRVLNYEEWERLRIELLRIYGGFTGQK